MTLGGEPVRITVSIGVVHWQGIHAETVEGFLGRSDKALYAAKNAGRNRVHGEETVDRADVQSGFHTVADGTAIP